MALTPRLDMRQSQSLVMTPQLQQAIKLLQLSNLELGEFVEEELEKNPMLERDEGQRDRDDDNAAGTDGDFEDGARDGTGETETLESIDFDTAQKAVIEDDARDVDYDNTYSDDSPADGGLDQHQTTSFADAGSGGGSFDPLVPNLEETVSERPSLRDHLNAQLSVDITDPVDRVIGLHLIDMLDEAGYISGDLEAVADLLECDVARVEATLAKLQNFDPAGIFARSLAECLGLQLSEKDHLDPCMQTFLDNLDLVGKRDFKGLAKVCGADSEDVLDMVEEIKTLDPKPALAFEHFITQPITPDVLMRPAPGGGWIVELNSESLPRVLVNNTYYAQVSGQTRSKSEKQYIADQFHSANWLVKSLHQRATTILKVASELVVQQSAFFAKGVQHLKPLVLRDIAEAIEMHESTVSRVTSNKYIATPRGIYELKYFFTQAIAATGGGVHSAESVRHRIKALIDEEAPKKILSDDKIVEILKVEGVEIARRTVAKYRESMKIPSSVQRRRDKA
ncbi:MAG: RNA polymerase factor sigma-54 [Rhodospirillales bacterium]|nr:RNA polymerase factor sigma-54 [Alphaproteobacteria bacterium]MBL6948802.1 RNA polymerase factor sigma-54 [Rhodospirillales bacterium]